MILPQIPIKLSCFCSKKFSKIFGALGYHLTSDFHPLASRSHQKTAPPTGDLDLAPWLNEGTRWAPQKPVLSMVFMYRAPFLAKDYNHSYRYSIDFRAFI